MAKHSREQCFSNVKTELTLPGKYQSIENTHFLHTSNIKIEKFWYFSGGR